MTAAPVDAEESVLGAMMLTAKACDDALAVLEPDGEQKFSRQSHGVVYRACRALHRAGKPVDAITVGALLEAKGKLDQAGGRERVLELATTVPAAGNVGFYALIVSEGWAKREIAAVCLRGHEQALNGVPSGEALSGLVQDALDTEARIGRGRKASTDLYEMAERLEERVRNPPRSDGVQPPFVSFPILRPSRLYVIAGFTADGKSAIAVQAAGTASAQGIRVGFATVEMSEDQLFDRMVTGYGVPLRQVESGQILPPNREAYRTAIRELSPRPVDLIDDPGLNAASLAQIQRAKGYGLLIVDHLHQIVLDGKAENRRQRLEDEVQGFVTLAKTANVPVILLAQLSRQSSGQPFPRPTLNMLRETGRIEQQAALVAFVWRHRDDKNLPTDDAEIIIAKDRFGPTGAFPLRFHPTLIRYEEVAP